MDDITNPKLPPGATLPNIYALPIHPLADEFPMANEHELASMQSSIKDQGILVPITIYHDGMWTLLEGRNRREAAKAIGYKFKPTDFKVFEGDLAAAAAYVEACNGHRRHMSKEQKEARALRLIAKHPNLPTRKLALIVGVSHTTIANLRKGKEDTTLKTLLKAWAAASITAQEQFVATHRVDLAEILKD